MEKRIYIGTYTTGDRWELSKGVICIAAKDRIEAITEIKKRIGKNELVSLNCLDSTIKGVLFEQSPCIE